LSIFDPSFDYHSFGSELATRKIAPSLFHAALRFCQAQLEARCIYAKKPTQNFPD
jgi:hypothetical protein